MTKTTGTARVKEGFAEMFKGGVIMDVVTADQARTPRRQVQPQSWRWNALDVIVKGLEGGFPAVFIRAPVFVGIWASVKVLAELGG